MHPPAFGSLDQVGAELVCWAECSDVLAIPADQHTLAVLSKQGTPHTAPALYRQTPEERRWHSLGDCP